MKHKWKAGRSEGDSVCEACGLERTTISNERRRPGQSRGTHFEYWVLMERGSWLDNRHHPLAGECTPEKTRALQERYRKQLDAPRPKPPTPEQLEAHHRRELAAELEEAASSLRRALEHSDALGRVDDVLRGAHESVRAAIRNELERKAG